MLPLSQFRHLPLALMILLAFSSFAVPAEVSEWIDLTDLKAWHDPDKLWEQAGSIGVDADNPRRLTATAGKDIFFNGKNGQARDLLSKREFGDLDVHVEFLIPKGSNSGVKLQGLYEIQICDSWGVKEPKGSDCGGIYPRAELRPAYHYLDRGVPPRVNACRKPGQWQMLDIVFRAPRFDAAGKKTADARFAKVILNGKVIHDNVSIPTPTGHAWHTKESATGPLLLQGDHGPVAFRHVRVRLHSPGPIKD